MRVITACTLILAVTVPSWAGHGNGKGPNKGRGAKDERVIVFTDDQRRAARVYYDANCPPGLAKKGNGCLPPGIAKKHYVVGQRLPRGVVIQAVPTVLLTQLGPAPVGYRYAIVDGDLVKLTLGTMLVADVIQAYVR